MEIFEVKERIFFYHDFKDDEDVEEIMQIGYFTTEEKMNQAIQLCLTEGIEVGRITIIKHNVLLNYNQRYVYVLSHLYSILNDKKEYIDYEYIFEPQSNKRKCEKLKDELKKQPRYAFSKSRIYDLYPPDGFVIAKVKLDRIWYPIVKDL